MSINVYICLSLYIYTDGPLIAGPGETWHLRKPPQKTSTNAPLTGFGPDFSDERLVNLKKYDHLLVRLLALLVASPWFGLPTWIFALYPWLPLYHHWRFFHLTRQPPRFEEFEDLRMSGFKISSQTWGTPYLLFDGLINPNGCLFGEVPFQQPVTIGTGGTTTIFINQG